MKALLVEDDELYREIIEELLQENGFQVMTAKNGIEALELLKGRECEFQLLVTDFNMPLMDGKVLIETILALHISIGKIIVLSGICHNESSLDELIQKNGNIHFVSKHVPLAVLREDVLKI